MSRYKSEQTAYNPLKKIRSSVETGHQRRDCHALQCQYADRG